MQSKGVGGVGGVGGGREGSGGGRKGGCPPQTLLAGPVQEPALSADAATARQIM